MNAQGSIEQNVRDAIVAVAMDYAEGWYTGDAARMERALHDDLIKRTIMPSDDPSGWSVGPISDKPSMVRWTAEGEGRDIPGDRVYDVEVLDVFRDVATVRCLSSEYIDYLHLAKFGDAGWKIVNVMWQLREGDYAGPNA